MSEKKKKWPQNCVWPAPLPPQNVSNQPSDMSHNDARKPVRIRKCDSGLNPPAIIAQCIEYKFINENLLRQAFTRRAFQMEYGLAGCYEELEFIGDSVLSMKPGRLPIAKCPCGSVLP